MEKMCECLLAVLVTAFGTVVYSIFGVGGWEGMGLGLAAMFAGSGAPVMPLRCVYGSSDRIKTVSRSDARLRFCVLPLYRKQANVHNGNDF